MDSCVNNNSWPAVGRIPNQGLLKKIGHKAASAHKRTVQGQVSPRASVSRPSNASVIVSFPFETSTSKESQSQSLPTRRRHSRIKFASHHGGPLSPEIPMDSRTDRDVVTGIASRASSQGRGSVKTFNTTQRRQRGTSLSTSESLLDGRSRFPRTRRLHTCNTLSSPNLDIIENRHESDGVSTTLNSEAAPIAAGVASVDASRGFRARLMLSEARKTIQNYKPEWSDADGKRGRPRTPFVMDIVMELKAQYAGYTAEDMYVTLEAMRRREDARPLFEHLAYDFSTGVESVDAYWDNQAKVWQDWKTPADEGVDSGDVGGSTFPPGSEPEPEAVLGAIGICQRPLATKGAPPSNSLSLGRANFPDSIERSTASWCPALKCDSVAGYHKHPQDQS